MSSLTCGCTDIQKCRNHQVAQSPAPEEAAREIDRIAAKYSNATTDQEDLEFKQAIQALIDKAVKEAQDNIVAFTEFLCEGTPEERMAKIKAAKEWNKIRPNSKGAKDE